MQNPKNTGCHLVSPVYNHWHYLFAMYFIFHYQYTILQMYFTRPQNIKQTTFKIIVISNPYRYVSYYSYYSYYYYYYYYSITNLSSVVVFVLHPICICICAIYVLIFVYALYMYFYLSRGPAGPPGGPKGPHLVAEGHQPSAGARSLAPVGGQNF